MPQQTSRNKTLGKGKMTGFILVFLLIFHLFCLSKTFGTELAEPKYSKDHCSQVVEMLNAQQVELSSELRLIKRELAYLQETINKPGITEIIGGIGYILGIFGVSYYRHARNLLKAQR